MAQSNYYQLYIENVLQLAETLVIKSEEAADGLNKYVALYHGSDAVNSVDPSSWKYYLNIAGQYHFSDTEMRVVSLDTLQEIVFSKENLVIHRATARGYAYGSREYRALVAQYPQQEMLILGILYPVDINKAIAAPNGTILGYPPSLVEANEYSLIPKLQRWVNAYRLRWMNNQYAISEELYPATALGIMYLNLVPAILNFRLEACKTNEAHSFHVRQYLASHGMLDVYMDNLTLKQALFLYRNIAYIERNSGQRNIFEWLVEHIMTERNLPIAEYVMRHDLSQQPTQLYPTLAFRKNPLNPPQSSVAQNLVGLSDLLLKEDKLAVQNPQERMDKQEQIQESLQNSASNVVLTKALESSMIDYSNATPYTLEQMLLHHWLWLSSNGYYYQAVVSITNPKTGERIPMAVKDAFVFMWYAFCASVGIQLTTIPQVYAQRVQRIPTPSVDAMMAVCDPKLVDRATLQQAHDWQPTLSPMISTEAFYEAVSEIYMAADYQRKLVALQEHTVRRAMVFNAVEQLYSDNICTLAPEGTTYTAWFAERNIKIDDFSADDLGLAYLSLTKDATGLSLHSTNSLKNLQRAMVRLLGQLSSYSVQFMSEINASDIEVGDLPAVRIGDRQVSGAGHYYVPDLEAEVIHVHSSSSDLDAFEVPRVAIGAVRTSSTGDRRGWELNVKPHALEGGSVMYHKVPSAPVYVSRVTPAEPDAQQGMIPVPGLDVLYGLTPLQRASLRDVYRTNWMADPAEARRLEMALGTPVLPGFDFTGNELSIVLPNGQLDGFNNSDVHT